MKIAMIFLIFSAVLFFPAIANLVYSSYILNEEYSDLQIIYDGVLEPKQQLTTPINFTKGQHATISIMSEGGVPLFFSIENTKGDLVIESLFEETTSFPLSVNQSGIHVIGVGNMGSQSTQIINFISEDSFFEADFVKDLQTNASISLSLVFISVIIFFIGLIMHFVKRKINQN